MIRQTRTRPGSGCATIGLRGAAVDDVPRGTPRATARDGSTWNHPESDGTAAVTIRRRHRHRPTLPPSHDREFSASACPRWTRSIASPPSRSRPPRCWPTGFRECGGGMAANASVAVARLGGSAALLGARRRRRAGRPDPGRARRRGRRRRRRAPDRGLRLAVGGDPGRRRRRASGLRLQRPGARPRRRLAAARATSRRSRGAGRCPLAGGRGARSSTRPATRDASRCSTATSVRRRRSSTSPAARRTRCSPSRDWRSPPAPARRAPGSAAIAARHPGIVGVTLGPDGFLWRDGGVERRSPASAVRPSIRSPPATSGTAPSRSRWPRVATIAAAARFANAAAAIKCTRPGGRSGAPTRAEVDALDASTSTDMIMLMNQLAYDNAGHAQPQRRRR